MAGGPYPRRMLELEALDHVQITAPPDQAEATIAFYATTLGLPRIAKPNTRPGAWFQLGDAQLHVGVEPMATEDNTRSKRHTCFRVRDAVEAERTLRAEGVAILPDTDRSPEWLRFYVRDPAGNRVEIGQRIDGR